MEDNRGWWRFFDGSISVSSAMLVAVLLDKCGLCAGWTVIGFVTGLTEQESGVIVVATIMLFPVTLTFYGGTRLVFAAKEAYEIRKRARLKKEREEREEAKAKSRAEGRAQGRAEGRAEGIEQVRTELERRGILTPELAEIFEEEKFEAQR